MVRSVIWANKINNLIQRFIKFVFSTDNKYNFIYNNQEKLKKNSIYFLFVINLVILKQIRFFRCIIKLENFIHVSIFIIIVWEQSSSFFAFRINIRSSFLFYLFKLCTFSTNIYSPSKTYLKFYLYLYFL